MSLREDREKASYPDYIKKIKECTDSLRKFFKNNNVEK